MPPAERLKPQKTVSDGWLRGFRKELEDVARAESNSPRGIKAAQCSLALGELLGFRCWRVTAELKALKAWRKDVEKAIRANDTAALAVLGETAHASE